MAATRLNMLTMTHKRRGISGQGIVEFAVLFPFMMFILFALIDGGMLMGRYNATTNAAREGARQGAIGLSGPQVAAIVRAQVHNQIPAGATTDCTQYAGATSAICVEWIAGPNNERPGDFGSSVRVRVKYRYNLITPLPAVNRFFKVSACGVARLEKLITQSQQNAAFGWHAGQGVSCSDA